MRKSFYLAFLFALMCGSASAQLTVTSGVTPQQLVNSIIGQGVTVFNITYTGDTTMAGTFNATGTNLGISNGILLTSGSASLAIGPNISTSSANILNLPGDSTLDSLSGVQTFDACILEFDFMPQSSTVSFRYIFASEEYPEFVCSNFNDVFAFLISGPGIPGVMNMAIIPGTTTPVAINTVNSGQPGSAYNPPPGPCGLNDSAYYVDNTNGTTIEYDGFTVPMTASAIIQPCGLYHLRIMIADAGDANWDSGVFIEGGSFFSNPVVNAGLDQTICSGNSAVLGIAAAPGYSYNWTPATGLDNNTLATPTATLVNSGLTPIVQQYVVIANSGTCLFTDTVNITVNPAPSASFSITPAAACIGETLTVNYTGAVASSYTWDFGTATVLSGSGSGPYQISYPAAGSNSVSVIAANPGCSANDTQSVVINPGPVATFTVQPDACPNETVEITFTGTAGPTAAYNWNFPNGQVTSGSGAGPYLVNWPSSGAQNISLSINDNGCISPVEIQQILIAPFPAAIAGTDATVCPTTPVALGDVGQPGFTYQWNPATGLDNPSISNPTASTPNSGLTTVINNYTVTVTSPEGCTSTDDVQVTIIPGIDVDFATNGVHCLPDNSIDFLIQGSYPAGSSFSWDFGNAASPSTSTSADQTGVKFNTTGVHTITLNANSGNCSMQPVVHDVEIYDVPVVDFVTNDLEGCSPLQVNLQNLSPDPSNSFFWQISDGTTSTSSDATVSLTQAGVYDVSLTATTSHGCSTSFAKTRYITVYATPVSLFATNPSVATLEAPLINFQNQSSNADIYYWDLGDSTFSQLESLSHVYSETGIYEITLVARNSFGCIDTSTGTIEINEGFSFYIPNSFSPNGDGKNDYFQGYGINFKTYQLLIYNRWGEKIYETSEYLKPWDGAVKHSVVNDVYVYKISVVDRFDESHEYVGAVTVVR